MLISPHAYHFFNTEDGERQIGYATCHTIPQGLDQVNCGRNILEAIAVITLIRYLYSDYE